MVDKVFYRAGSRSRAHSSRYALVAIFACVVLFLLVGPKNALPLAVKLGLTIALLMLAYLILYAVWLRRPMLRLTPNFLVFRRIRIPWASVADVTDLETEQGSFVGIVLTTQRFSLASADGNKSRFNAGILLVRDLERYGAVAIPKARGIALEELRREIADYRADALTNN